MVTDGWRQRAEHYVGNDPHAWVAGLSERNDLPLLRAGDLADEILSDAASVTIFKVSERRATFSRANVLAEVHRQFHGVRFASPDDRIDVAERTADLAVGQSLLISAPELHFTPERLRRGDGTSRFRAKGHEIYTTAILIEAEARLLDAGRETDGPVVATRTVAAVTSGIRPGRGNPLSIDQAVAVELIATSGRRLDVSRDEILHALYEARKQDIEAGKTSLMIAADLGTVGELNARAQCDRIAAGSVSRDKVTVSGGATAGVGDQVVTRQNNRRISTGKHWVRNGDQWRVDGSHADGSLTLQRRNGIGKVHVAPDYVREHVELAYASTAHRAQGRTVDTAHAMVGPTTSREVLYVSATRGKEANHLYVDTHYDPDPQTSHNDALGPITAKGVLVAVLRNEGAEVSAHEAIRRAQHEAEGMERLSAEYLTLATEAQAERWDALLARSGLSDDDLDTVAASAARGPLFAGLRDAEARCLDVESALPKLVAGKSLADAADVASVLHSRVDRWSHTTGGRRRHSGQLIAGSSREPRV